MEVSLADNVLRSLS